MPQNRSSRTEKPQPQLDIDEPKEKPGSVNIFGTTLTWRMYNEYKTIRESLGMSEREFLRFCIAQTILSIKYFNLKVYLSKEYAEMTFRQDATEALDKLQRKLEDRNIDHERVE